MPVLLCSVICGGMQQVVKDPEVLYAAAANSGAVNTWDTEWDYPPSHFMSAKTQSEDNAPSDNMFETLHVVPLKSLSTI